MDEHLPSSVSPTQLSLVKSAQVQEAARLKLHTIGPANLAYLERDSDGRVALHFRGLLFGVDDYVPDSLIRSQLISPRGTAGEFVCRQMITRYGYREDDWPDLARQFLLQHTTHQHARSKHKR